MPTIASSVVPPPKSWDEFEDITLAAVKLRWANDTFFRNGRTGQKQDGVDIFGDVVGRQIGVQCKNSVEGISMNLIQTEIENAEKFTPKLAHLYIATTAKRDAILQKTLRKLSKERCLRGEFRVDILFWDDICQEIAKNDEVFFAHYPQFRKSIDPIMQRDQELFIELTRLLHSDGVIGFLSHTNMAGFAFSLSAIYELDDFYYVWDKPEREFIIPELESLRRQLHEKTGAYLNLIAYQTFPTGISGRNSVPEEWEYEQPERFNRVVSELHSLAKEIVVLHSTLVRRGRAIFVGTASVM
jgi:hypothetical protein